MRVKGRKRDGDDGETRQASYSRPPTREGVKLPLAYRHTTIEKTTPLDPEQTSEDLYRGPRSNSAQDKSLNTSPHELQ